MIRVIAVGVLAALAGCERSRLGQPIDASAQSVPDVSNAPRLEDTYDAGALSFAKAIRAGSYSSFALLGDGRLATWGRNDSGQLAHEGSGDFLITELGFAVTVTLRVIRKLQGRIGRCRVRCLTPV